jgi:acyl-homoserine-lactone acylase
MAGLMAFAGAAGGSAHAASTADAARWRREAADVEIVRDTWGIAHVYGKRDADAVFGAIYAQAEDDFHRIERNYQVALGELALAEGESAVYSDLRQRLFVDPQKLQALYRQSPPWLMKLMQAWADGLNYFLATHPRTRPQVLASFEPWMALSFTEGSIGGDIETVDLEALKKFYPATRAAGTSARADAAPDGGSNGFAIAPALSATGHALLWINPHTSFYFRSELQMVSEEGLDAYGASTWGQFFIYQGFNTENGWMHTSYGGDAVDEYAETVVKGPTGAAYRYGTGIRPMRTRILTIRVKNGARVETRRFTVFATHHGPIVRSENGKWIAVKLFQDPLHALEQSYSRTKTRNYRQFRETQELRTDTSNNTVYADADGTIAYFHGNFIPRRDPRFDFTRPVDGSDPATEWQGKHTLDETIMILNPPNGWLQNTNNWPFSAAGPNSPARDQYPAYMWIRGENPRGLHAVELLSQIRGVTLDSLIAAAFDAHLTAFEVLLPPLFDAYDRLSTNDARRAALEAPIAALRAWDRRTAAASVPTTLAVLWGQTLLDEKSAAARAAHAAPYDFLVQHLDDDSRLEALRATVAALEHDFGRWSVPWGEVNRYQRLTDDIVQRFDDERPSLPVGLAPGKWGALASFDAPGPRATRHIYGTSGNSFLAAVEFGPSVRAKAIMTGGESGDPRSPHFDDQAQRFIAGELRDVPFTRDEVAAHAEHRYHPGTP